VTTLVALIGHYLPAPSSTRLVRSTGQISSG
jgi:hypothetical protein